MRPALQKSPISSDRAFELKSLRDPYFDPNWHFHPEYQLFTVLKGTGTRFIGDHVQAFQEGDLVFTGPNLPHLWRSDPEYFEGDPELYTHGVVVYFPDDFPGADFLQKQEMYRLRQLFEHARRGLEIRGRTGRQVVRLMLRLLRCRDFERVLLLLRILNILANSQEYTLLASAGYTNSMNESEGERMSQVHAFVMKHFREKITLEEVAGVANMSASSFSRYFKKHANKTFSSFLSEIRIGYACKLLIEKNTSIAQACYQSGFSTLSNFNRQFKAVVKLTPSEYKRMYDGTVSFPPNFGPAVKLENV